MIVSPTLHFVNKCKTKSMLSIHFCKGRASCDYDDGQKQKYKGKM